MRSAGIGVLKIVAAIAAGLQILGAAAVGASDAAHQRPIPAERVSDLKCKKGRAGPFPCHRIDLRAFLPSSEVGGGTLVALWGWKDPETGREYAIVGKSNGTAFIDVTKPNDPVYLGSIPKSDPVLPWVDVEVFKDHAFITSESAHGLQIFDLTRLRGVEAPQTWTPDLLYPFPPNAHTLRIDPDSGFLYMNGSLAVNGMPHIVDIGDPAAPVPAGFIYDDGYVHDSHCVVYRGPHEEFRKKEICLTQNEDSLNIYDVSDKLSPQRLAKETYDGANYTHSGWLTQDHKYFLMSDEGDEQAMDFPTATYIWDVRDLTKPKLIGTYHAKTKAIDHNIYIKGRYAYQASYTAGLRILDTKGAAKGKLREVGYFDVMPDSDEAAFDGSWGAYPFLPSGNVLVTGMGQGFFVVDPKL